MAEVAEGWHWAAEREGDRDMDQSVRVLFVNSRSSLPLLYNDTVRLKNVEEGGQGVGTRNWGI